MLFGLMLVQPLLAPTPASALGASSSDLPLYFLRSADCTDEVVEVSGSIHLVNKVQADGSVVGHFNYQGVTGLGLTSGESYRVNAVDNIRLRAPFPSSITSVRSFLLVSRGAGSNLLVHVAYHITINAAGEVTASIEDLEMQCS